MIVATHRLSSLLGFLSCLLLEVHGEDGIPPLQPGFTEGMMVQSRANWVGNEHYFPYANTSVQYFCSQAMFWPGSQPYHTWQYVEGKCEDVAFDPLNGWMAGVWFGRYTDPGTIEAVRQYKCLIGDNLCSYDITTDPEFSHCKVQAKACGAQLNEIFSGDTNEAGIKMNSCDVWQINLMECPKPNSTNEEVEMKLAQVVTYAEFEGPGFDNYVCPNRPTFDPNEIVADPVATGGAAFVLQASFVEVDLYDPCSWDCFDGNSTNFTCPAQRVSPEPTSSTSEPSASPPPPSSAWAIGNSAIVASVTFFSGLTILLLP